MTIHDGIVSDRGSKYAVSGGPAMSKADALALIKELKRDKRFAKAKHNTWGFLSPGNPIKKDDGEEGAGLVILRMLDRARLENHLTVVTRCYGGKHLGGDRFRHVQSCMDNYLDRMES